MKMGDKQLVMSDSPDDVAVLSFQQDNTNVKSSPPTLIIQKVYSNFELNIEKNLHKKAAACTRNDIKIERKRGQGGFIISLNPAIYELYKHAIRSMYGSLKSQCEVKVRLDVDEQNNQHRDVIQVTTSGKSFYTINLFHTTSRMQINGRHMLKFIDQDLLLCEQLVNQYLVSSGLSKEQCKALVQDTLKQVLSDSQAGNQPESNNNSQVTVSVASSATNTKAPAITVEPNEDLDNDSLADTDSSFNDSVETIENVAIESQPIDNTQNPNLLPENTKDTKDTSITTQHADDSTGLPTAVVNGLESPSSASQDSKPAENSNPDGSTNLPAAESNLPDASQPTMVPIMDQINLLASKIETITAQNKTTNELLRKLSDKVAECTSLKSELENTQELNRTLLKEMESLKCKLGEPHPGKNKSPVSHSVPTSECLLIGDDTLTSAAKFLCNEITFEHIEGATINDIHEALKKHYNDGQRYGRVIIQCGATNCESYQKVDANALASDYKLVVKEAKQLSNGNVTLSSVLPRSDNADMNVKALNAKIFKISEGEKCAYIDNDLNFRYVNGLPDLSVLDGQIPNLDGTKRLLSNMDLPLLDIPLKPNNDKNNVPKHSLPKPTQLPKGNRSSQHKGNEDEYVKVQGHKCTLSNFNRPAGGLYYYGQHFCHPEELYHYRKARYYYQDELAECFRWMDDPGEISRMSKMYVRESPEWREEGGKGEEIMYDILEIRAEQDINFRNELLSTGTKTLLHTVPDKFWGTGSYELPKPGQSPTGRNRFGTLLMQLRSKLQNEPSQKPPKKSPQVPHAPTYAEVTNNPSRYANPGSSAISNNRASHSHQPSCNFCGETGHLKDNCRHKAPVTCYQCGHQGHKQKHCT